MHDRRRIASLDGVRALALIAVLAYHAAPGTARGGFLGVDVFFVLSGFLLSSLLLDEHVRSGTINYVEFAKRRVRRIAPALTVLLGVLIFAVPLLAAADAYRLRGDVLWSAGGLTNWHLIADGSSYFSRFGRPSFARHLWSVAVEIQFYLVCPFLVAWLARRRRAIAVAALGAGIAASATASALLYRAVDPSRAYYGTDARVGALLIGVLLAVVLSGRAHAERPATAREGALGLVAFGALVAMVVMLGERSRLLYPAGFLACEVVTAVVIVLALRPGWLSEVLGLKEMQWLGQRSYGIYLWYWPLAVLVHPGTRADWAPLPAAAVTVGGAVVLGALSYRFVETRYLKRSTADADSAAPARSSTAWIPRAAVLLVAVVLLARVSTTNELAVALQAGQKVLAAGTRPTTSTTSTVPPTTIPPTSVAPDTAPPESAPPETNAANSAPALSDPPDAPPEPVSVEAPLASAPRSSAAVTAIGDSVMVIASQALTDRLGPGSYIDAKQNRQFSQGVQVAQRLHDEGSLGPVLVVHLGNNGPVQPGEVENLMAVVSDVPHILLVTVRVDAPWQDAVNDTLRAEAGARANVQLVDWYGYSAGHDEWFQRDGTHFRASAGPGNDAYGDLIAGAIPTG